ncbi:NAD regulator [Methyloligella sp. 2.7D]|uniref:NUDIX hydrolase n=1 Tax=unclassified Methyloligella TaxID=2625955 RepID=UPI00157CCBF6|nr:NAD regulator [Methyloligella sp. GL2]QKP78279.1 NAD regulator [Methyloligella sp. GL2]
MAAPSSAARPGPDTATDLKIEIGLNAAIVTVAERQPQILVVRPGTVGSGEYDALPFGPFAPRNHRTLEIGLRAWVEEQTGLDLGYVEQLYTFGDRGRHAEPGDGASHMLSVGYLALSRGSADDLRGAHWSPWYAYFPWEDWRKGKPAILTDEIEPRLKEWAERPPLPGAPARALRRPDRLKIGFGIGGGWDEEKVLERYELLYEAGLVTEAKRDGRKAAGQWQDLPEIGRPMAFDHRRILATAISRLRGKLKYRPVVFELLPAEFTLYDLQQTVEAISGTLLHKQNFRRLVEHAGLVEQTGNVSTRTGGRPARLYRFRREVVLERPAPGLRVKPARG